MRGRCSLIQEKKRLPLKFRAIPYSLLPVHDFVNAIHSFFYRGYAANLKFALSHGEFSNWRSAVPPVKAISPLNLGIELQSRNRSLNYLALQLRCFNFYLGTKPDE